MLENNLNNCDNYYKVYYSARFSCFIGSVLQDRLMLFRPKKKEIPFDKISFVEYKKNRVYLLNYILATVGIILFCLFLFKEFKILILLTGSIFTLLSIIVKKEKTFIKIILRESSIIVINLKKKEEKKGQIFVKKINQHLF